jgi:hypothetical protein
MKMNFRAFNWLFGLRKDKKKPGYPGVFRVCGECKKSFYLTSIEISFYITQDVAGPMKCRICKYQEKNNNVAHPPSVLGQPESYKKTLAM